MRRMTRVLAAFAMATCGVVASQAASAQSWSAKPIRIVVPFTAGAD